MRVTLEFSGTGVAVLLEGETAAERALLSFIAETPARWEPHPQYPYRPGEVSDVRLHRLVDPRGAP